MWRGAAAPGRKWIGFGGYAAKNQSIFPFPERSSGLCSSPVAAQGDVAVVLGGGMWCGCAVLKKYRAMVLAAMPPKP
jgi:hypothetical protein